MNELLLPPDSAGAIAFVAYALLAICLALGGLVELAIWSFA